MSVLAIDLETKNMSYDIGGFGNTHMFQVSTVFYKTFHPPSFTFSDVTI